MLAKNKNHKVFQTQKTIFTYQVIEPDFHKLKHEAEFLRGLALLGVFAAVQQPLLNVRHSSKVK